MEHARTRYRRVLLKISGDGFTKSEGQGIDVSELNSVARQIARASLLGVEIAIVVGGGNIVRGAKFSEDGISRITGDYMGMLATIINALALQDALEKLGKQTRLLTAVTVHELAEPFIRRRCIGHLEKGRLVILAGGTGNPHFTTDTAAALRATEINAQVLLKATKVDGVYSADPLKHPNAILYEKLSYMEVLSSNLKVMDSPAISLCMEHRIPIIVFNMKKEGNIEKVIAGERVGTLITDT